MKQDHPKLSTRRQSTLLSLTRSTLYYQPRGESAENLKFMSIIDKSKRCSGPTFLLNL